MIYNTYGKTGLQVSAVGFGGMRFDMSRSLDENADLVRYAVDQGINYLDTAPDYCDSQSEVIIGKAAKSIRDKVFLTTKGMPTRFDTKQKAIGAVNESLKKLDTDYIDFYHVWCLRKMEHFELAMNPGGQYEGLLQCQKEGKIRHIVFSSHQPGNEVRRVVESGKFEGGLLGVNILNFPYRWDGVMAAYEAGLGVVAMNPLAGGAIPKNEEAFKFLATGGETATEAALRFIISCPQITVALNGFSTREHVDMACRVADTCQPYTDEELDALRKKLGKNLNAMCTGCGYCDDCPVGIPVPAYMQFYNEKQLFGTSDENMVSKVPFAHEWGILAIRKAEAQACVRCRRCEDACTQHLPIVERLKDVARWEAAAAWAGDSLEVDETE